MNILVTGAYGQLGRELVRQFPSGRHRVIPTGLDSLDITRPDQLELFFLNNKPGLVINCAAYNHVDRAESDREHAFRLNASGPENLAALAEAGRTWIIHFSTDYVFDGKKGSPYLETDPAFPLSTYGESKLEGEKAVLSCSRGLVLRTSWLYSGEGKNFVRTILQKASGTKEIRVVSDQTGSPTSAADLAGAVIRLTDLITAGENITPGLYHYSNEGSASWYEFAGEIVRLSGLDCRVTPVCTADYPLPAARPAYSVLSKEKIKNAFGFTIPHWKESLEAQLNIIKSHGYERP